MGETPSTYPPPNHVMSDLDITTLLVTEQRSVGLVAVADTLRAGGAAALGLLSIVADTQAAMVALVAATPHWIATVDLSLAEAAPMRGDTLAVDARLVRAGSKIVVVEVCAYDASDRDGVADAAQAAAAGELQRVSTGLVSFTRIPASASAASGHLRPAERIGVVSPTTARTPNPHPLLERIGLRTLDAGVVEVERTPYVGNSFGALNGGVLGMIFQGAAESAHPGLRAADLQIHYLSQARSGPVRTRTDTVRADGHHALCRIEAYDTGADDQLLAVATVVLRQP